jgi:hypothetical protein
MVVRRPDEAYGPPVEVLAMVDSGAYRSAFPLAIADDLGIQPHELAEDPRGGGGVGSRFRVWTATVSIMTGVRLFQPPPDGTVQPWGPGFRLDPAFIEHDAFLLGRADFFRAFDIVFSEVDGQPVFHLDTR